jgi:hypothetical protein
VTNEEIFKNVISPVDMRERWKSDAEKTAVGGREGRKKKEEGRKKCIGTR